MVPGAWHGTGVVKEGGDSWFFVTADYSGGHLVEDAATGFVRAAGGKVVGHTLPALATTDYSSSLLQAQASGAKVVAKPLAPGVPVGQGAMTGQDAAAGRR